MSKFLADFSEFMKQQPFEIIRYSQVLNDGEIETFIGTKANPCQNTYSVAKTFTATAIGILFDQGKLTVDEKVTDILADELPETGMDPRWYDVTVEMALTHSAGLRQTESTLGSQNSCASGTPIDSVNSYWRNTWDIGR